MKELVFTLTSTAGATVLTNSPDGWDESLVTWERSDKYFGIFRTWTIPLKFVKEGAAIVRTEFYTYGMKAEVTIKIEKLNKTTLAYATAYLGKIDFATFKDTVDYTECSFVDSGLAKILKDNSQTEYLTKAGIISWGTGVPTYATDVVYDAHTGADPLTYRYGIDIWRLGSNLLDLMSDGEVTAATIGFKSDYLDYWVNKMVISPGKAFRYDGTVNIPEIKTSFDDWFKSINALFNLGMGIEIIGGVDTLVVEEKSYFFDSATTIDVGDVKTLTVSLLNKLSFGRIKIGYEPKTYTDVTIEIATELNAISNWAVVNEASGAELDLVSKYRGDWMGCRDIMLTETDSNDDDIFFVCIKYQSGSSTLFEVNNQGRSRHLNEVDEDYCYNTYISPRRNLIRWYNYINSCLLGMNGDTLKLTSADNDIAFRESITQSLSTQWLMERLTYTILDAPKLFLPIQFEIETAFPYDMIAQVSAAPSALFAFSFEGKEYTGYCMKIDAKLAGRGSQKITLMADKSNDLVNLIR